ncbi:hypothetical protein PHYPSEUDO_014584 [Phytophthora pseudosyringae]|uniref:Protein kinase domain-containing protein n=1 Tax=Phytophthora pseudosyringae TaxID=221518 RepID=A0A8T1W0A3_9STRA|nr:hypothetical protein PHYPSEUDO_014584 [Phytophthora pseudosyringae]
MRRANVVPDLSFLPVGTQQQLQNMIAYIQIQKELRKLPRVDGIRIIRTGAADCSGVDVQLAVLKKNVNTLVLSRLPPHEAMLLKTDEDVRWLCSSNLSVVYILLQAEEQKSPSPVASVDLLGLNRLSPKKPHGALPGSPARLLLSSPAPVGSVDLLGLNHQPPKKLSGVAPPPSPARLQLRSSSLAKILKPGCTVREVEWKDLAIQKQVGTGSSCQVYKGSWRGAEVAVKSFTGIDRGAVEREFANEVDTMHQLGPNTSLVLLLAVCANPLSIVLEYLPFSLFELINGVPDKTRRIPPFPTSWTKRVHMMLDIARGLQFLHSFDIIHRNLLMTAEGRVKLADFGISRSNDQSELMTGCCGTFQWMAPEVLTSQKYSLSADVYSFGVIMWEICECAAPFKDLAPGQIPIAVVQERRRPIISPKTPSVRQHHTQAITTRT